MSTVMLMWHLVRATNPVKGMLILPRMEVRRKVQSLQWIFSLCVKGERDIWQRALYISGELCQFIIIINCNYIPPQSEKQAVSWSASPQREDGNQPPQPHWDSYTPGLSSETQLWRPLGLLAQSQSAQTQQLSPWRHSVSALTKVNFTLS